MRLNLFTKISSNLYAENRLLKFGFVALIIIDLIGMVRTQQALNYRTTIVVPPVINSKIEMKGGQASETYIREYVRYISSLAFNYQYLSARSHFDELLLNFTPETFNSAKETFYALADKIETAQVNSTFYITRILLDKNTSAIEVTGNKRIYTNDNNSIEVAAPTYLITYRITNGRFFIVKIEEKENRGARPTETKKSEDSGLERPEQSSAASGQ